jgi:hypothetical protein
VKVNIRSKCNVFPLIILERSVPGRGLLYIFVSYSCGSFPGNAGQIVLLFIKQAKRERETIEVRYIANCRSQWPRGLRHEMSSPT